MEHDGRVTIIRTGVYIYNDSGAIYKVIKLCHAFMAIFDPSHLLRILDPFLKNVTHPNKTQ